MNRVIEIVNAGICTGCAMCMSACPYNNITLKKGNLGFPVPQIHNEALCKGCKECIKDCPAINESDE